MADYDEIDEAEEEALLKSDDETDLLRAKKSLLIGLQPPTDEEDSLMNEAAQLVDKVDGRDVVEANSNGDDDDDDDDDDGLDAANEALLEYKSLLKELQEHQYVYDKYLRLCELSHATEDLDNIRQAYNLFATVYPLAPELWLKYLKIEVSLTVSENEVSRVEALFRKALCDYYSVDIAFEFAAFAKQTSNPDGIWQEILGTYGSHCLKGQEFFKRYRQQVANMETLSSEEKQSAFIKSYLQELKYPLNNMEESYIEFKVFYEKNKDQISNELDWQVIDKDYFKAKSYLERILSYEKQLEAMDAKMYRERAELYLNYIKESDDFLDENILQTIYERMVVDCCLNAACWLAYIDYIEERDEVYGRPEQLLDLSVFRQNAVDICSRALRNCTWSEKLYIKRMQLLEKLEKPREMIQEVLESSMSAGFQAAESAVAVWLEYLTYLRRHTNWENEEECEILRKNFNLAWTILGQQWGVLADCNCEILQFWGRLEYGPLQDPKRGKELWTTVMESSDNTTKSGLWIEFAHLEMRRDLDATRKLFRKALHMPNLDNPNVVASAWERFERCNGTVNTLNTCLKERAAFLAQSNSKYSHNNSPAGNRKLSTMGKAKTKRKSNSMSESTTDAKKTKTQSPLNAGTGKDRNEKNQRSAKTKQSSSEHGSVTFKDHENAEIDLTKDHLRIFLSNLDYNLKENDIRENLPELDIVSVDLICSANGRSRGFGYLELANETEVEKALALDRKLLNGRPLYISSVLRDKEKRQKFKFSDGLEPRKLFIKGLPDDTTKEEVEKFFSQYGKLLDVRLVYHKSGQFKRIAYIEFEEEASAGKAVLGADTTELRGHKLSVAISAPPPKPSTSKSTANPPKLLGLNPKRPRLGTEQKPRMSLIPNVVRKQLTAPKFVPATNGTLPHTIAPKTNADFRKLLEK